MPMLKMYPLLLEHLLQAVLFSKIYLCAAVPVEIIYQLASYSLAIMYAP